MHIYIHIHTYTEKTFFAYLLRLGYRMERTSCEPERVTAPIHFEPAVGAPTPQPKVVLVYFSRVHNMRNTNSINSMDLSL